VGGAIRARDAGCRNCIGMPRRPRHPSAGTPIFALGVVMDVIYEVTVFRWIYPGEVLIIAFVLACRPYLFIRGPVGRIARRVQARREVV